MVYVDAASQIPPCRLERAPPCFRVAVRPSLSVRFFFFPPLASPHSHHYLSHQSAFLQSQNLPEPSSSTFGEVQCPIYLKKQSHAAVIRRNQFFGNWGPGTMGSLCANR